MKKLLFVITHMGLGGAEKALVSLLNNLDYSKYEVDLQLYNGRGFNLQFIPKEVKVLNPVAENCEYFERFKTLLVHQMKKGRIDVVGRRLYYAVLAAIFAKNEAEVKYYQWRFVQKYLNVYPKHYDVAIGFLDGSPNYYVIDKVNAAKKICWVHNDYSKMPTCKKDYRFLNQADLVATISPKCVEEIRRFFPKLNSVELVYNMNSPILINELATLYEPEEYKNVDSFIILSIGRLCEQKAYHFAIRAAHILKMKGINFQWFIIGDGELRDRLSKLIVDVDVADCFHLLGLKENPYPYIKNCDIVVQCSTYEGKSIALDEAKILHRPIICTDYNSARDQVEDQEEGIVVPISETGVAEGVERIIFDRALYQKIVKKLAGKDYSQTEYLEKYLDIFEGEKSNHG